MTLPSRNSPLVLLTVSVSSLMLGAAMSGCAQPSALENALGETVREAQALQALPTPRPEGRSVTTDGVIAVHGVARYQQSWVNPPAPVNVLNIQAGGAAGSTQGSATLPR